jgi:hypothetical protein
MAEEGDDFAAMDASDPAAQLIAIYTRETLGLIQGTSMPLSIVFEDAGEIGDYRIEQGFRLLDTTFGVRPMYYLAHENVGTGVKITRAQFRKSLASGMLHVFARGLLDLLEMIGESSAGNLDAYDVVILTRCLCGIYRAMNATTRDSLAKLPLKGMPLGTYVPRMDQDWAKKMKTGVVSCVEMRSIFEALSRYVFLESSFEV